MVVGYELTQSTIYWARRQTTVHKQIIKTLVIKIILFFILEFPNFMFLSAIDDLRACRCDLTFLFRQRKAFRGMLTQCWLIRTWMR